MRSGAIFRPAAPSTAPASSAAQRAARRVLTLEAEALTNAAWAYFGQAQDRWFSEGPDDEEAAKLAAQCEGSLTEALQTDPDFDPAIQAVFWLGELLMTRADTAVKADPTSARLGTPRGGPQQR